MDQVDSPRIALTPEAPLAASPPEPASAPDSPPDIAAPSDANDDAAEHPESSDDDSQKAEDADVADKNTTEAAAEAEARSDEPAAPKVEEKLAAELETPESEPAKQRPQWVKDPPRRVGETHRDVIITDEYATVPECYRAADIQLKLATYDHLARLVGIRNYADGNLSQLLDGAVSDSRLDALAAMGISIDYIRHEIAREEYVETVERSFGPMKKLYTLVEFTPPVDRELRNRWNAHERRERFGIVGLGASSVLGLIGLAYGLLKVDTVTKGYYSKWLFTGVPAAIIGLVWLLWFLGPIYW
jgi:hypothetical protein